MAMSGRNFICKSLKVRDQIGHLHLPRCLSNLHLREQSHSADHFNTSENTDEPTYLFQRDFNLNHISTSPFQKALLSVGSAMISLSNPARGDMIATLGETTGPWALQNMLQKMEIDKEGQEILRTKPRINSRTVDLEKLKGMPENSLGRAYSDFLRVNKVTPDSRAAVQFVDDVTLAYVMQRYREVHDLFHAVLQMRTNMLGEVTVKWVEAIQTQLPMCIGGAVLGSVRLAKKQRQQYLSHYLPWAVKTGWESHFLMNVYYERRWEQPLEELQEELNIQPLQLETGFHTKA